MQNVTIPNIVIHPALPPSKKKTAIWNIILILAIIGLAALGIYLYMQPVVPVEFDKSGSVGKWSEVKLVDLAGSFAYEEEDGRTTKTFHLCETSNGEYIVVVAGGDNGPFDKYYMETAVTFEPIVLGGYIRVTEQEYMGFGAEAMTDWVQTAYTASDFRALVGDNHLDIRQGPKEILILFPVVIILLFVWLIVNSVSGAQRRKRYAAYERALEAQQAFAAQQAAAGVYVQPTAPIQYAPPVQPMQPMQPMQPQQPAYYTPGAPLQPTQTAPVVAPAPAPAPVAEAAPAPIQTQENTEEKQ
ncbi:MAG: hypothetical protein LBL82_06125 [Oscillospiraceae bacterium]|jgi:hypothetical protein|nr:hypothetical protein [Oscillospiraceae bacterium]